MPRYVCRHTCPRAPANTPKKRKTSHDQNNGRNDNQDDIFTSKPTAVFTPKGGRSHTLSIAIPGSIVAKYASPETRVNNGLS